MVERPLPIVVINYNTGAFIDEFCASLAAVTAPPWRLIVIDSGSSDDSASRIERAMPEATIVVRAENIGFAAGVNAAVRMLLEGDEAHVLFLNPDTRVTPGFLDAMRAAADDRTVVVPKLLFANDPRRISTHAGGFDWRLGVFRSTFHGQLDGPATAARRDGLETASFACALVPLRAFQEAGLFDERFFMYYEETDWLRRARACGYRIRYEPAAVVYHRESGSSGGGWMTPFKQYYATRNRLYLVRRHATSRVAYAAFTAYFWAGRLPLLARLAVRRDWRLARAMLLGMRDYYRGRMGRRYQVPDL